MSFIDSFSIDTEKEHPFPYDVTAIKYASDVKLDQAITFFVGDNGSGKSTLIETLAFHLQLPHMDGSDYQKRGFQAAARLVAYLKVNYKRDRPIGFFFRAEDFGDYINSIDRRDAQIHASLKSLEGDVPEHIIQQMKDNANMQIHHMRKNFGQELTTYSHGEAYLRIIEEKIVSSGIYILDEPEAALSPARQLSLIYHIQSHLKVHQSQFIIATHSPILMSMPNSALYEITDDGMKLTDYRDTEHYSITKNFLNHPEMYLRHL